jgi:CBS-domain-containing membrane protein
MPSPERLSMDIKADAIQEDGESIDKDPDAIAALVHLRKSFLLRQRRRLECKG